MTVGRMSDLEKILQSGLKPKAKVAKIVEEIIQKKITAADFMDYFKNAATAEKGTCADVMKHVSSQAPEILGKYIDEIIRFVDHPLPRVKWGTQEAIGNLSKKYPEKAAKAIPKILENTKSESTVVRWCAAYALTEIAKNNSEARKKLMPVFDKMIKGEKNNGVKNVYLKTLKEFRGI